MRNKLCKNLLFVLVIHLVVENSDSAKDWCKGPCACTHVACYDPDSDPHFCPNAKIIEISSEDKQELIDRYNYYRHRVASGKYPGIRHQASRMLKIHWDDDLEDIARASLLRCRTTTYCTKYDENSTAHSYTGWRYTNLNETELSFFVMDTLFHTIVHHDYKNVYNEFSNGQLKSIEHNGFLQLKGSYGIAKPTSFDESLYRMGCAFVLYDKNDNNESNFKPWMRNTCYYLFTKRLTNNMVMFKIGSPCSECDAVGMKCSKDYPGLCETSEDAEDSVTYYEEHNKCNSTCSNHDESITVTVTLKRT